MASIKHDGKAWRARYREPSGREREKRFTRKTDAQRWLDEQTAQHVTGTYVDPKLGRMTVGEWADRWLASKSSLAVSTLARYRGVVEVHVRPSWDAVRLADVTHDGVQAWVSDLAASGAAPNSVLKAHRVMSMILGYAVRSRRLASNPAYGVTLPRASRSEHRYLSAEQVDALAAAASPVWSLETRRPATPGRLVVLVLAYCGLRWGELAALKVSRLDLLRRRLHVAENVVEVDGELHWKLPKDHERRWVPIPRFLVDLLAEHVAGKAPGDLVFATPHGAVMRVRNARRDWFDRAVELADVPAGLHPHELRHTAASLAVSAGASVLAVARMLGHAKPSMTLDVYADLFDADLETVAERLHEVHDRAGKLRAGAAVVGLDSARIAR